MKTCMLLVVGIVCCMLAATPGYAFNVYSSGPLSTASITFTVDNTTGFNQISEIDFGLSNTQSFASGNPQLVIDVTDSPFNVVNPSGGSSTFFYSNPVGGGYSDFGFTFTGFDAGETFRFSWDPDTPTSATYGAVIEELVGTDVAVHTNLGIISGSLVIDSTQDHLTLSSSVPEPCTLLLLSLGLVGFAVSRKRFGAAEC